MCHFTRTTQLRVTSHYPASEWGHGGTRTWVISVRLGRNQRLEPFFRRLNSYSARFLAIPVEFNLSFFRILLKSEHNCCPCCVVNLEEYGMLHKDGTFVVQRTFVSFSNEGASVANSNARPQM